MMTTMVINIKIIYTTILSTIKMVQLINQIQMGLIFSIQVLMSTNKNKMCNKTNNQVCLATTYLIWTLLILLQQH